MISPGDKVRHLTTPGEPFATPGQHGRVLRVAPGIRHIPAQALVAWGEIRKLGETDASLRGDFETWENLNTLMKVG